MILKNHEERIEQTIASPTTHRKIWCFHGRSNRGSTWSARKWSTPWDIVPRWSNAALTKQRLPWFVQATCIAKPSSFPFVLSPSVDFASPYIRTRRQRAARIRGEFLLSDLLLKFCKHLRWIVRHKSFYFIHDCLFSVFVLRGCPSISALFAGHCLRISFLGYWPLRLLAQYEPEVVFSVNLSTFLCQPVCLSTCPISGVFWYLAPESSDNFWSAQNEPVHIPVDENLSWDIFRDILAQCTRLKFGGPCMTSKRAQGVFGRIESGVVQGSWFLNLKFIN